MTRANGASAMADHGAEWQVSATGSTESAAINADEQTSMMPALITLANATAMPNNDPSDWEPCWSMQRPMPATIMTRDSEPSLDGHTLLRHPTTTAVAMGLVALSVGGASAWIGPTGLLARQHYESII